MYNWRTATKPTPDVDGMVHVDDQDNIWQWVASSAAWVQKKSWYLKEVGQLRLPVFGIPTDSDPLKNATSIVINEWDNLYSKAFVRFEFSNTGQIVYSAWYTKSELTDYLSSVLDKSSPTFSDIVLIKVYQVFDPSIRSDRTGHSNIIYALMRGKHAYMRKLGRETQGIAPQYGLSTKLHNYRFSDDWHVDTAKKFIYEFYGIDAAPNNNDIFYFQRASDNTYHLPKVGTIITTNNRWWYNTETNAYQQELIQVRAALGSPKFFGTTSSTGVTRSIQDMRSLKGNRYLSSRRFGVVVYPVVGASSTGAPLRAFLVRPYGVDAGGIGYPQQYATPDWDLVSENSYPDSFTKKHAILSDKWVLESNDLVTFRVNDAIAFRRSAPGNAHIDSSSIPKHLNFYVQNNVTGVRSEALGAGLQIVRRKTCMPIGVLPAY